MNEVATFNIKTREYEFLTDCNVSLFTDQGRFDVKFSNGGIEIYHIGNLEYHDQVIVTPKAQNVVMITGGKRK